MGLTVIALDTWALCLTSANKDPLPLCGEI